MAVAELEGSNGSDRTALLTTDEETEAARELLRLLDCVGTAEDGNDSLELDNGSGRTLDPKLLLDTNEAVYSGVRAVDDS